MAAGKFMKLKTAALKKINSLRRSTSSSRSNSFSSSSSSSPRPSSDSHRGEHDDRSQVDLMSRSTSSQTAGGGGQHPVYVGKSRRRYLISSEVLDHPAFQELAHKSDDSDEINVECEVVLFEHLLWMLENNGSQVDQSFDELIQFYTY